MQASGRPCRTGRPITVWPYSCIYLPLQRSFAGGQHGVLLRLVSTVGTVVPVLSAQVRAVPSPAQNQHASTVLCNDGSLCVVVGTPLRRSAGQVRLRLGHFGAERQTRTLMQRCHYINQTQ